MGMFSKGFGSVRREQKRQEQIRESLSGKLFNFFLTEKNPEADIIFLNNQPLTFSRTQNRKAVTVKVSTIPMYAPKKTMVIVLSALVRVLRLLSKVHFLCTITR